MNKKPELQLTVPPAERQLNLLATFNKLWFQRNPDDLGGVEVLPNIQLANGNSVGAFIREYSHGYLIGLNEIGFDDGLQSPLGFITATKDEHQLTIFTWADAIGGYFEEYTKHNYTEDTLVESMFAENSPNDAIQVYNHRQQGLGTLLFDLLTQIGKNTNINLIEFKAAHTLPVEYVKSLGYQYTTLEYGNIKPNYILDITLNTSQSF